MQTTQKLYAGGREVLYVDAPETPGRGHVTVLDVESREVHTLLAKDVYVRQEPAPQFSEQFTVSEVMMKSPVHRALVAKTIGEAVINKTLSQPDEVHAYHAVSLSLRKKIGAPK